MLAQIQVWKTSVSIFCTTAMTDQVICPKLAENRNFASANFLNIENLNSSGGVVYNVAIQLQGGEPDSMLVASGVNLLPWR
jgi:hypothetical protein